MHNGPLILGQYRPLDSFIHRLDTRAKLLPIILVLILGLFTNSSYFYLSALAALIASLLLSGITVEQLVRSFQPILWLVAITFLYHLIFTGHASPVVTSLFGWDIHIEALRAGAFFSLRLILFVSMAFLVTLTSSPSDLAEAAAKLLGPLKRWRVPVNDIAMILFISMRFVPILHEEFVLIKNAQMTRGVDFHGSLVKRARRSLYLLIPVLVAAVNRADELALALQARGYDNKKERTFYSRARMGMAETSFMLFSTMGIVALYLVTS